MAAQGLRNSVVDVEVAEVKAEEAMPAPPAPKRSPKGNVQWSAAQQSPMHPPLDAAEVFHTPMHAHNSEESLFEGGAALSDNINSRPPSSFTFERSKSLRLAPNFLRKFGEVEEKEAEDTAYRRRVLRLLYAIGILCLVIAIMGSILHLREAPVEADKYDAEVLRLDRAEADVLTEVFGFSMRLDEVPFCSNATSCEDCHETRKTLLGGVRVPVLDPDRFVIRDNDEGEAYVVCATALPSVGQVSQCRSEDPDKLAINPVYFEPECLSDVSRCPNCDNLVPALTELNFTASGAAANATESRIKYVQLAEIYLQYKRTLENEQPVKYWSWAGAFFFAATVATTIGYGNFAVQTSDSKWIISFLAIPTIALFGYALTQLADIILESSRRCGVWLYHGKYDFPDKLKTREKIIEFIQRNPKETFTFKEVVQAFHKRRLLPTDEEERNRAIDYIRNIFTIMDTKGEREIPKGFLLGIFLEYYSLYEEELARSAAVREAILSFLLSFALVAVGSVVFYQIHREENWSGLDSIYFSVVTLSTVGFGDFAPNADAASIAFWYVYISFGLGLIAAQISSLSVAVTAIRTDWIPTKKVKDKLSRSVDILESVLTWGTRKSSNGGSDDSSGGRTTLQDLFRAEKTDQN